MAAGLDECSNFAGIMECKSRFCALKTTGLPLSSIVIIFNLVGIVELPPPVERVLFSCEKPIDREEMQKRLGIKNKKYFIESYLRPALKSGFLEMTIPDKANSPLQRYRLTEQGQQWLKEQRSGGDLYL